MAVASSSTRRRAEDLLGPFIDTLGLAQPITIPTETLLGAITHFLSTLPNRDVSRLAVALVQSHSLWNSKISTGRIRDAISLAVESKVDKLQTRHRQSWLQARRVNRAAGLWLSCIIDPLSSDTSADSTSTTHIRLGLLRGLQAVNLDSTKETIALEESVVLSLAQIIETSMTDDETLQMLSEAVMCLDKERVNVLDPMTIIPLIQNALLAALDSSSGSAQEATAYSSAIARLFDTIVVHEKLMDNVLPPMADFVTAFQDRAERIERGQRRLGKGKQSDTESKKHKLWLSTFLVPASTAVDILVARPDLVHPPGSGHLAMTILETLATFSSIIDASEGPPDGYDHVLHGSLDLLASTLDPLTIRRLFGSLIEDDKMTPSRMAFALKCGELLVNQLDRPTLTDVLLPLANRALHDKQHQQSFEAAHAFMIATIRSAGDTDDRPILQVAFALEILPYYSSMLLKHFKRDWISAETFTESYLAVIEVSSKVDDRLTDDLIAGLMPTAEDQDRLSQTLLATSIAGSQFIRRRRLRAHLDDVGSRIIVLPMGENRLDLTSKLFTMISQSLSDNTRGAGMTWWWEWKDRLLDREGKTHARSKL